VLDPLDLHWILFAVSSASKPTVETLDACLLIMLCFIRGVFALDLRDDIYDIFFDRLLVRFAFEKAREFSQAVEVANLAPDTRPSERLET
ncbi:MAG: hypothetical protein ACREBQ_07510, partial [Nitrososphaerales archaeon]